MKNIFLLLVTSMVFSFAQSTVASGVKEGSSSGDDGESQSVPSWGCSQAPKYQSEVGFEAHVCRVFETDVDLAPQQFVGQFIEVGSKIYAQTASEVLLQKGREAGVSFKNLALILSQHGIRTGGTNYNCDANHPNVSFYVSKPGKNIPVYNLQGSLCERMYNQAGILHATTDIVRQTPATSYYFGIVDEITNMILQSPSHGHLDRETLNALKVQIAP